MTLWLLFATLSLPMLPFLPSVQAMNSIRTVAASRTEVVTIHTAIGFSTLLEFDVRPKGVIVGDQDAFKVEYTSMGIALKPLVKKAKTNLLVTTEYGDFRFLILSGSVTAADFVVKVQSRPTFKREP